MPFWAPKRQCHPVPLFSFEFNKWSYGDWGDFYKPGFLGSSRNSNSSSHSLEGYVLPSQTGKLAFYTLASCEFGTYDSEAGAHYRGWRKAEAAQFHFLWRPCWIAILQLQHPYHVCNFKMLVNSRHISEACPSANGAVRSLSTLVDANHAKTETGKGFYDWNLVEHSGKSLRFRKLRPGSRVCLSMFLLCDL